MNFYAINRILDRNREYKFRNYLDDATSGTPTVGGVHEKNLPHDLQPLSFKDMMQYAAPDYDQTPEPMQSIHFNNLDGHGGKPERISHVTAGIRPQYNQVC